MGLTNEQKVVKRKEISERRAKNALAKELMPIAYKQSNIVASSSGIDKDDITGQAMLGIAEAMYRGNSERPGFYRLNKMYARGYCLNYLRDKSRDVRLPRSLTLAYLAEQKALRDFPAYRLLSNAEKSVYLGIDLHVLLEARSAITMYSKNLDNFDSSYDQAKTNSELEFSSTLVLDVVAAGVKVLANSGKIGEAVIEKQFYEALRVVLNEQ